MYVSCLPSNATQHTNQRLSFPALGFVWVESLLTSQDPAFEASKALSLLESSLDSLEAAGFQKLVYEDFYDALAGLIRRIASPGPDGQTLNLSSLLEAFQNPESMSHIFSSPLFGSD